VNVDKTLYCIRVLVAFYPRRRAFALSFKHFCVDKMLSNSAIL
jgi:hypothetical protein